MIKAVFFDFDGTLIDYNSMLQQACESAARKLHNILKSKGVHVDFKEILSKVYDAESRYAKTEFVNRDIWWIKILEELGINVSLAEGEAREITLAYWNEMMKAKPYKNVKYTLEYLKSKGYKLGIITNTDGLHSMKRKRIEKSGLAGFFDLVIVAGEDTEKQKPNVEPFLKAARLFKLKPNECMMVGDTLSSDILGAKKAGFITVYLKGREHNVSSAVADYVIDDIIELTKIL